FLRDNRSRRPVFGENERLQTDPHFRDHVLFYEYFHGDTGRGVGASHQTGWTGLVAKLLEQSATQPNAPAGKDPEDELRRDRDRRGSGRRAALAGAGSSGPANGAG
ncbi:MAG TPA: hypothetical protein VFB50_08940, partial [Chloroflexota bacterium]|nr:hypothetical protein [Chloroflexota bacterium]